ncbi:MAG: FAD-binding oxidoreductase [Chthoniobacterales bacterium]
MPKKTKTSRASKKPFPLNSLRRILPAKSILLGEKAAEYGGDKWFAWRQPDAVVLPSSTKEVSAIMRWATKHKIPVTPRGAGCGYVGSCVPLRGGLVLSTERMKRILEINSDDFVAVVQPAVITGKLQAAVAKKGLMYPPDPASLPECSIGGNIATNAGGPRCLKYGVTRHYVLGLEVVLADGSVARIGGRCHKNKTGFDLVGMFVGSEGMLGVVTEATLRLLPLPPARGALSAGFSDIRAAAAAVQSIFKNGYLPAAVEIADRFTLEAGRNYKENKGRFSIPPGNAHLLLEIDGQAASVRSELKSLKKLLLSVDATKVETAFGDDGCASLWNIRRSFSESLKATGLRKLNQDTVVPRGRLVDLIKFAEKLKKRHGLAIACFGHAGDGNIHVNIMVGDYDDPKVKARADAAVDDLFRQVIAWKGAVTGEHGIGIARMPWWPQVSQNNIAELHHRLKSALDPDELMNPGKFA